MKFTPLVLSGIVGLCATSVIGLQTPAQACALNANIIKSKLDITLLSLSHSSSRCNWSWGDDGTTIVNQSENYKSFDQAQDDFVKAIPEKLFTKKGVKFYDRNNDGKYDSLMYSAGVSVYLHGVNTFPMKLVNIDKFKPVLINR